MTSQEIYKNLASIELYISKLHRSYPKNPNTRVEYSKIFNRIYNYCEYDLVRYAADKMISKKTYYKCKSAVQYGLAFSIKGHIEAYAETASEEYYNLAVRLFKILKRMNPVLSEAPKVETWQNNLSLYPEEEIRAKKASQGRPGRKPGRQQRIGKRKSIIGLPSNWKITICRNVPKRYRTATLILALTGCRSSELGNGIQVSIDENGHLICKIQGAKVSDAKGHEVRIIGFDPETNVFAGYLKGALERFNVTSHTFFLPGANAAGAVQRLGDRIRYTAQKRLGLKKVSAYSLRHQFASDLRDAGFSKVDIAMAMGHRTTRMRKHYGLKSYGKGGGLGIVHIDASQKELIRTKSHGYPPAHLKNRGSMDN